MGYERTTTALPLLGISPTTRLASRRVSSSDDVSSVNLIFFRSLDTGPYAYRYCVFFFLSIMKSNIGHSFERDCDANLG